MKNTASLPPPSATAAGVVPETVEKAVNALLKWRNSKSDTQKAQLFEQDEFVYLIVTLRKIPPKGRTNAHKIPIPHSLHSDSSELCLIIDDRPKSSLTKDEAMKKIKSENIPVSKVIKFSKLKTDYRPFEAKRKLCDSYDMFFADNRVIPLLPKLLGKQFFKKKRIPVPVDLRHKNWKEQIDRACGSAMLFVGTGTCSVLRVGRVTMEKEELVENVLAAINGVVEIVPRKWANLRSFHLKLLDSLALPVYQAVPDMKLKIEGLKYKEEEVKETEDEVKGKQDGKLGKRKSKKGRIHEVQYMDSNISEALDEDELGSDDGGDMDRPAVSEDDEMVSGEVEGKKKRKKDKKGDGKKESKKPKTKNGLEKLKSGDLKVKDKKKKKTSVAA